MLFCANLISKEWKSFLCFYAPNERAFMEQEEFAFRFQIVRSS